MINNILNELHQDTTFSYLDDVMILTKITVPDDLHKIKLILEIFLNYEFHGWKSVMDKLNYLGKKISDPMNFRFNTSKTPKNRKPLQRFLGLSVM